MNKSEKTRQLIIEKAAPVFNKKGFNGTSLADLIEVTGLSKGSIYGNFNGKKEVARESFRYNVKQLTKVIRHDIQQKTSAKDKLYCFLNFYRNDYQSCFNNGGCAILNTATESDDGELFLKEEVTTALLNWKKTITKIIEQGIEEQEFDEVEAENFSVLFVALIEGSIMLSKTTGRADYLLLNLDFLEEQIEKIIKK